MKHLLSTIIFIFAITPMNSQIINSIGIKGGASFANQLWFYKSTNYTAARQYKTGMYGAATIDFFKATYLNLTADVGFCQKGNKETGVLLPDKTTTNYTTTFNYITLSPMLKIKYPFKHIIPYGLLGLRCDYQLSYTSTHDYSSIESDFHKVIFGMSSGAGVEYKLKNIGINVEFQYHYDFSKVMDTHTDGIVSGILVYNNAYIISAGVKYYLHKKESKTDALKTAAVSGL